MNVAVPFGPAQGKRRRGEDSQLQKVSAQEAIGFGFRRLMSSSLIAFLTTADSILPSRRSSVNVARVMQRASPSKKSRRAARPSLRPNPSVPKEARRRGIHLATRLGKAFK